MPPTVYTMLSHTKAVFTGYPLLGAGQSGVPLRDLTGNCWFQRGIQETPDPVVRKETLAHKDPQDPQGHKETQDHLVAHKDHKEK